MKMSLYHLPHHPSLKSIDPLGACTSGEDEVPQWDVFTALLTQATEVLEAIEQAAKVSVQQMPWASAFCELLENIAYSLHGDHTLSTDGLRRLLRGGGLSVGLLRVFRICLFRATFQLQSLFPNASLTQLSVLTPTVSLSCEQTDSLLAHLLLGTFEKPAGNDWGRPGFSQLFADDEATKNTSLAYLKTMILHFVGPGYSSSEAEDFYFDFHLVNGRDMPEITTSGAITEKLSVILVDQPSEPSLKNEAFVLIAANSQPGPGPAGTQEERIVGQSPALAIASLLTPALASDEALITSAFPVHARWQGHGREARVVERFAKNERPRRRYIIADALPLDVEETSFETKTDNVMREVRKLWAGFEGAKRAWLAGGRQLEDLRIEMPPWGCGAFGGTVSVKVPCMMIAAALAGLKGENLELLVTRDREEQLADLSGDTLTVKDLYRWVTSHG